MNKTEIVIELVKIMAQERSPDPFEKEEVIESYVFFEKEIENGSELAMRLLNVYMINNPMYSLSKEDLLGLYLYFEAQTTSEKKNDWGKSSLH